jgi:hypothetical protein
MQRGKVLAVAQVIPLSVPSDMQMAGVGAARSTATQVCFSHPSNQPERLNTSWVSWTNGRRQATGQAV